MISFFGTIGIIFCCASPSYGIDKHSSGFIEMNSDYVSRVMGNQKIIQRFVYAPKISENDSHKISEIQQEQRIENAFSVFPLKLDISQNSHKTPEIRQEQSTESALSIFPLKLNIPQVTAQINHQYAKTMWELENSNSIQIVSEETASNIQPVNNRNKRNLEKTDSHQPRKKPRFNLDQKLKQYSFVSVENIDGKYREVKPYTPKRKGKYPSVNNGDGYPRMDKWKYK